MGHKAGDKIDMKVMEVARFKDGKAVEHWSLMEPADMMKMMGNMQQPMAMPDSAKKKM
jgi:predicted SnoaL-like aldol condensation-catalyzing enzyme